MNELGQGLTLSGLGILITFSALGILIGLILALKALFPVQDGKLQADPASAGNSSDGKDRGQLRKQAAAVGVSVLISKRDRKKQGSLGKLLEEPAADWWRKGVDRAHGKE